MSRLRRLLPDGFILMLLATVVLASLLPVGPATLERVGIVSTAAIMLLFFVHGLRIRPAAVLAGVRHWRLQGGIAAFGYLLLPLAGVGIAAVTAPLLGTGVAAGFIFLAVLPTTVQSSIAYSSLAGGNVAAAVVASAVSNIAGVVLAPLLFALLAHAGGAGFSADGIARIAAVLLLPFVAGQLAQRWLGAFADRHRAILGRLDRLTILLAVFTAFAEAVADGLWSRVDLSTLAIIAGITAALLAAAFAGAWWLGALLRLDRADRTTFLFAGAHKSLATGAPMARILFPGGDAGAILLPLLLYHQLQLMLSAMVAARLARGQSMDVPPASAKRA